MTETETTNTSPPAADTGNSVTEAPAQEQSLQGDRDGGGQPSTGSQQRNYQYTNSSRPYRSRGRGRRFSGHYNQDRRQGYSAHETGRETREMNAQDGTSSQQMDRNGRRGHSSYHSRHGQTRDEQRDENVRENADEDGAVRADEREECEGEGAGEGEGEVRGDEQGPRRMFHYRRESARDAIHRLLGSVRRKENDVDLLATRNEQLSDEIKILKEELARLRLEQDQTGRLLQDRTAELSSAQLFLGEADITSVADVARMVDMLNAEISQISISVADSLTYRHTPAASNATAHDELLQKWRSSIGGRLCDILARRQSDPAVEFDPMITQLVLQAGLSKACHLIINDWNPPFWSTSSTVDRIYGNMRLSEGQVIAGRWRALARTYITDRAGQDSGGGIHIQDTKSKIQEANADYLTSVLRDLLTITGWALKDPRHLPLEYSSKMRFLSDEALKLHETTGRGITSKDLIIETIPCDTPFNPTTMEDADRQRDKPDMNPNDNVACTVELGLKYKSAKPGGGSEEIGIVLKPKVLLSSVLVDEGVEVTPDKGQN